MGNLGCTRLLAAAIGFDGNEDLSIAAPEDYVAHGATKFQQTGV
jgi:hypothetical protein